MDGEQNKINPEYLLPGTMVGPWEIVDLLGKGGFGVAYKVRRDGRYYALKLTLSRAADLGPEQRERHEARVRRECGILLQLNHPNIVRVHGFERWPDLNDGYLYIVMDLVNGQKLYTWRERSVPSLRRICHVFQRIALALAEAHARGAFHRDIKSENVLVGIDGDPILIDWGIARSRGAVTVTQDHSVLGTHSHFPPEYCRYIDFDTGAEEFVWTPQSELHSVGYLLYEMLTGRSPFNLPDEASTSDENIIVQRLQRTTQAIKSVIPTLPSLINGKVPGALDRIVMRLLEKNSADRYASGAELAAAFEEAVANADAAWDAPFDVPARPSASAPTRGGRPARTSGQRSPQVLPALDSPRTSPKSSNTQPRSPTHFRPPTQEVKAFEPPEVSDERQPSAGTNERLRAAHEQLVSRLDGPSRLPGIKMLIAGSATALLLIGGALLHSKKASPQAPESLLRKVERTSARASPPAPKPDVEELPASSLPPTPTLTNGVRLDQALPRVAERERPKPLPVAQPTRETKQPERPSEARRPSPPARKVAAAQEDDSALEFGQRLGSSSSPKTPARYHVETGARIRVSLDVNLDSRTVSGGPAVVRLRRAYISDGNVVFPAGTMAYGDARAIGTRFTVHFSRLVLPDKVEVPFDALAYDIQDRKPGLAPSRRIATPQSQDGTASKVGRAVANTMLTAVNGGLAQDAARNAAETALNARDQDSSGSGEALLLDAGAEMDMLVTKPF